MNLHGLMISTDRDDDLNRAAYLRMRLMEEQLRSRRDYFSDEDIRSVRDSIMGYSQHREVPSHYVQYGDVVILHARPISAEFPHELEREFRMVQDMIRRRHPDGINFRFDLTHGADHADPLSELNRPGTYMVRCRWMAPPPHTRTVHSYDWYSRDDVVE